MGSRLDIRGCVVEIVQQATVAETTIMAGQCQCLCELLMVLNDTYDTCVASYTALQLL